ncbi:MAG: hypothetical protein HQK79_14860 [Desulfobacterales bacterium]|nr:hypothetical protein [Desulfobacterales bacterium]MBF0397830.1 hypothetical protein [Desulfobacterales bacterium]
MVLKSSLEKTFGKTFEICVLFPIKSIHSMAGDKIWKPLDKLTAITSKLIGKTLNFVLPQYSDNPIARATSLIDMFEELVGIHGKWEIINKNRAVKRIYKCKFACKWGKANKFCTILGETMGKEALPPLFQNKKVTYEIKSTLSQGDKCCEYYVSID